MHKLQAFFFAFMRKAKNTRSRTQFYAKSFAGTSAIVIVSVFLWSQFTQADAPSDQYEVTANTVQDNFTGLTWQRVVPNGTFTRAEAITFCNNLVLAGASDWRLPHIKELVSIIDATRGDPSIDTAAFPNTPNEGFWSTTPSSGNANQGWMMMFNGVVGNFELNNTDTLRVRCVRQSRDIILSSV